MNCAPEALHECSYRRLMEQPPKLHFWGGEWKTGGLGPNQRALIERCLRSLGAKTRVIETGAGLSTPIMLALGSRVTSFFTKSDLRDRIAAAVDEFDLPRANWEAVIGPSEFSLPKYLDGHPALSADLVLIDGGHLIHTVFTDFTYGFASLREGGILVLDDLQAPSVSILYGILGASNFVEQIDIAGKTAAFRKMVKSRLPGNWNETPVGEPMLEQIAADWNISTA